MSQPWFVFAIAGLVALIVVVVMLRDRITKIHWGLKRTGPELKVEARPDGAGDSKGVDLSKARFEDDNEFTTDGKSSVKAVKLQAGSGNKFQFGSSTKSSQQEKPKS